MKNEQIENLYEEASNIYKKFGFVFVGSFVFGPSGLYFIDGEGRLSIFDGVLSNGQLKEIEAKIKEYEI